LANIWNFSDLQVSTLFYGVFFGLALVSSLTIYLFSVSLLPPSHPLLTNSQIRPILFLLGTIYFLLNSIREYFPELMTASIPDQDADRGLSPLSLSLVLTRRRQPHVRDEERLHQVLDAAGEGPKRPCLGAQVRTITDCRIDSLLLICRHIARTCVVEDEGIEMKDAAAKKVM
jgi:hypothetical protein